MKKAVLVIALMFLLCGCEKTGPEYLISSIGFDNINGKYNVLFEAVIINSENAQLTLKLLKGEGDTVDEAVSQIKKSITQPLLLSHCGVIIIGENINYAEFDNIKEYCYNSDPITLSAYFVKTKNAKKLLSSKPVSSVCVGYDIMGLIKQNKGIKSRFFEILSGGTSAKLPLISVKDGGLYYNGTKTIYK